MIDRRNTPDILAALGALPKEKTEIRQRANLGLSSEQSQEAVMQDSSEQLEEIINRAAQSVVSLGRVMGKRKLVDWLDEIRDTIVVQKEQETAGLLSTLDVAAWLKKRLGAAITTRDYLITGRVIEHPYKVDVWARIPGKQAQIDMWIECKDRKSPVKRKDVLTLVR